MCNLAWSHWTFPLIHMYSELCTEWKTERLPPSPLWLLQQRPQWLLFVFLKQPSIHLAQSLFIGITSACDVLLSNMPVAHYLISFRCLLKHHLIKEIFLDYLSNIASPKPFFHFFHNICYPTSMVPFLSNYNVSHVKDKNLLSKWLYPQDLKEHLVQLNK